jgi:hypothetical protein
MSHVGIIPLQVAKTIQGTDMRVAVYLTGIVVLALALTACAQNAPDSSSATPTDRSSSAALAPTQLAAVRMILKFKSPAPAQGETLWRVLETQSKARVQYIASVAADTHVYLFTPVPGSTYAQLLQRVGAISEVAYAEFDAKARPH